VFICREVIRANLLLETKDNSYTQVMQSLSNYLPSYISLELRGIGSHCRCDNPCHTIQPRYSSWIGMKGVPKEVDVTKNT
jgi:hypothetical protein